MDMMFMDDAIDAIIQLMEADSERLINRNAYNVSAMSVDPETIKASIQKEMPEFELGYDVDPERQAIADSWPNAIDSTCAKEEWGFSPNYDLDSMTELMLKAIKEKDNLARS